MSPPTIGIVHCVDPAELPADLSLAAVADGWVAALRGAQDGLVVCATTPTPRSRQWARVREMLTETGWFTRPPAADDLAVVPIGIHRLVGELPCRVHVVGEAACSFDPVSGQGTSAAIRSAVHIADDLVERGIAVDAARPVRDLDEVLAEHVETTRAAYATAARRFPESRFWRERSASQVSG